VTALHSGLRRWPTPFVPGPVHLRSVTQYGETWPEVRAIAHGRRVTFRTRGGRSPVNGTAWACQAHRHGPCPCIRDVFRALETDCPEVAERLRDVTPGIDQ
jgi:hypothetical protein